MTENLGGQPLGKSEQFRTLRDAGDYRQVIAIIEQLLDSNSPGKFTRLSLSELITEVNDTVMCVRPSDNNYHHKKKVLENLRKARASLQLAIDEYDKKKKLYDHIEVARQALEEALSAW